VVVTVSSSTSVPSPYGSRMLNLNGAIPLRVTATCHAQPAGVRFSLSVVGSSTSKLPFASSVSTTGVGTSTASLSSYTTTVGVNVTVPIAATPAEVVYVPVTTRVTMSSDQLLICSP
jgi:hypothetical protein